MRPTPHILITLALCGCGESPTGADPLSRTLPLREENPAVRNSARRIAAIDTQFLSVPSRAQVGEAVAFDLPVASGGCQGSDTTVTTVGPRQVTIWPYRRVVSNQICTADYRIERRAIRVLLRERGETRLQIVTRNGPEGEFLVLERRISVE
jgi:hypothetical protein